MRDALDVSETIRWIPVAHGLGGRGKSGALAHPDHEPSNEECRKAAGEPGRDRADANDQHAHSQSRFCTEFSRPPPAEDYRAEIGPGERAENEPDFRIGKGKMTLQ